MTRRTRGASFFVNACREGNLEEVKRFLPTADEIRKTNGFLSACVQGNLNVVMYLHSTCEEDIRISVERGVELACNQRHYSLCRWLVNTYSTNILSFELFKNTCCYEPLETAIWLYNTAEKFRDPLFLNECFLQTCDCHPCHTREWLYSTRHITGETLKRSFPLLCEYTSLKVIQWLYNIDPVVAEANDETNFVTMCKHNDLEKVKWLYAQNPNIDLTHGNYRAFRYACKEGCVDIALWLFSLDPRCIDVEVQLEQDHPFYIAVNRRFWKLAEWFVEQQPWKYSVVFQENGKIGAVISSVHAIRWHFRKYPLLAIHRHSALGTTHAPAFDKEKKQLHSTFVRLPSDLVRHTLLYL